MLTETETETVHEAPIGHLISAIVTRLNPLAQAPKAPPAPLEYRSSRRLASSLGAASVGTTIASRTGGGQGIITSVTRVVQDGEHFVEILATAGASRLCRPSTEVVTWAWKTPLKPAQPRTTPADEARRRARAEMVTEARQSDAERLADATERRAPEREPQILTAGLFAGLAV